VKKEEEELKEQIDMMVSKNFRSICAQRAEKITFKLIWGWIDQPINGWTDG
jgi:hypothetical protein